jgi:beta-glucosidase
MTSYNAVNGVPASASKGLLTTVLRERWGASARNVVLALGFIFTTVSHNHCHWVGTGFDGFLIGDFDCWAWVKDYQHFCDTDECSAAAGVNAGMDQEGMEREAIDAIPAAINAGLLNRSQIETSVERLFAARIKLGMLDPPLRVPWVNLTLETSVLTAEHKALALRAARESICLYKNSNGALPNSASSFSSSRPLLLVGPQATATELLLGNYATPMPEDEITTIREGLEKAMGPENVNTVSGCLDIACQNTTGFAEAETAIRRGVGAVVVTLGLTFTCPDWSSPKHDGPACHIPDLASIEGEGHDRDQVELPGNQRQLVSALRQALDGANSKAPLVVVLLHGGTLALQTVLTDADAIIDAWYPGMMGGQAVADVLTGVYNPGGRTPATWYKATADLPTQGYQGLYPSASESPNGITYRYFTGDVDIPFGAGMSYTEFAYTDMKVRLESEPCDPIAVSVTVTNTGHREGDEVVQVYLAQADATAPVPTLRLAAFTRIHLAAGESKQLRLTVQPDSHSTVLDTGSFFEPAIVVEPGTLTLSVGGGQPGHTVGVLNATVSVKGAAKSLSECQPLRLKTDDGGLPERSLLQQRWQPVPAAVGPPTAVLSCPFTIIQQGVADNATSLGHPAAEDAADCCAKCAAMAGCTSPGRACH